MGVRSRGGLGSVGWMLLVVVGAAPALGQEDTPSELRSELELAAAATDDDVPLPRLLDAAPDGEPTGPLLRPEPGRALEDEVPSPLDESEEGPIVVEDVPLFARLLVSGLAGVGGVLGLGAGAALVVAAAVGSETMARYQGSVAVLLGASVLAAPLVLLVGAMAGAAMVALPLSDDVVDGTLTTLSAAVGVVVGAPAGALVGALALGLGMGIQGAVFFAHRSYLGPWTPFLFFALVGALTGGPLGAVVGGFLGAGGVPAVTTYLLLDDERTVEGGEE